jgi:hypothetical protein
MYKENEVNRQSQLSFFNNSNRGTPFSNMKNPFLDRTASSENTKFTPDKKIKDPKL